MMGRCRADRGRQQKEERQRTQAAMQEIHIRGKEVAFHCEGGETVEQGPRAVVGSPSLALGNLL